MRVKRLTDKQMATLFVDQYQHQIRFVLDVPGRIKPLKRWFVNENNQWQQDIWKRRLEMCKRLYETLRLWSTDATTVTPKFTGKAVNWESSANRIGKLEGMQTIMRLVKLDPRIRNTVEELANEQSLVAKVDSVQ